MPSRIERSSAIPIDLFGDQAIFEMEMADIWHQDWVFATTVDAVAEPGDFVPVMIGRQSVIIVRGDDYQIRALANVCSHRGSPLVDCAGRASRFSCPYHAWTYDIDGELLSVPYAQSGEVVQSDHGLASYLVEQWHGLIFVSLNNHVEPFAERVATIDPYVKSLGLARLQHDVEATTAEVWDANWKVIYANALDSYSQFRVHAETVEPFSPTDASYYLAGSARATVTGGESQERADHVVISVPPSFVAIAYPDSLLWQAVRPLDVGHSEVTTGVAGESSGESSAAVNLPGWDAAFVDEDRAICERMQTNVGARWQPGPLLEIERALGDFHDYLAWRLAEQAPEPPTIAASPGDRPEPPL